ncbi:MAG: hypothetical protein KJN92_02780 [Gemmatimonadetes bacterium]|nr:hypothetical protein [Gemmatimonadota bacterium]
MRFLCHIPVDDVAWTSETVREVVVRGIRLMNGNEGKRVAEYFLRSCSDPGTIEPVVTRLFLNPKPPTKVQDLARSCFVDRRTLERKWIAAWSGSPPLPLKALVDWALLLGARDLSEAGIGPRRIAKELGIHKRTLDRIAGRLVGLSSRGWFTLKSRAAWRAVVIGLWGDSEKSRVSSRI